MLQHVAWLALGLLLGMVIEHQNQKYKTDDVDWDIYEGEDVDEDASIINPANVLDEIDI